ncbi:MAG: hypothetical protein NUV61_01790 [Candidatus Azambacteria bacterium]|nr:hypothetical protein [Candidatus Azambacteria bacterium]
MKRIILIIVITLIFIGIIVWYQAQIPIGGPTIFVTNTNSENIKTEIEVIGIGDLDAGFLEIDADISTL